MEKIKVTIGEDIYNVELAITEEELYKGLSGRESLKDNEGMLFAFDDNKKPYMVMRGMEFPLDIIFIADDKTIVQIETLDKDFKGGVEANQDIRYILELNKDKAADYKKGYKVNLELPIKTAEQGISLDNSFFTDNVISVLRNEYKNRKIEGSFEKYLLDVRENPSNSIIKNAYKGYTMINSLQSGGDLTHNHEEALMIGDVVYDVKTRDIPVLDNHLQLLDNNGYVVYNIKGGERIFSIKDTNSIYDKVMNVQDGGTQELESLGELMINLLNIHDDNKPQFVKK